MENEPKRIEERYSRRKSGRENSTYSSFVIKERESLFSKIISHNFNDQSDIRVLEVGSGGGGNIHFFKNYGLKPENLFANELLESRVVELKSTHPDVQVIPGNALEISEENKYDIVFQSTVFTSILNNEFRIALANKMIRLVKPGGIILWYDFTYNNPKNKDVKKVGKEEVHRLFAGLKRVYSKKCTLAPPIGRRVGKLYPLFNYFPFLRTHYVAAFKK